MNGDNMNGEKRGDAVEDYQRTGCSSEREYRLLAYISQNPGKDVRTITSELSIGGKDMIRRLLADYQAEGWVRTRSVMLNKKGKSSRIYYICPAGSDRIQFRQEPCDDDWSVVPTLGRRDDGDAVAVPRASVPMPAPASVPMPEPVEEPDDATPVPAPAPAPAKDGAVDVEALRSAVEALRAVDTGVADIDFDVAAIIARTERRIREGIGRCPCCGGEMAVRENGKAIVCGGCHIAVALMSKDATLTDLICTWNRRV